MVTRSFALGRWLACVALTGTLLAGPRAAQARGRGRPCVGACALWAAALEVTAGVAQLHLADTVFSGSGDVAGVDGRSIGRGDSVRVHGRELGVVAPLATSIDLHWLLSVSRFFYFGGLAGVAVGQGERPPLVPPPYAVSGHFTAARFGPELGLELTVGPAELRVGLAAGYRNIGFPITGFARMRCGRGGTCYPNAEHDGAFVEPRVMLSVLLPRTLVRVGAYAGGDLMPDGGFVAGATLAIDSSTWHQHGHIR